MIRKKKRSILILSLVLISGIVLTGYYYYTSLFLTVSYYTVRENVSAPIRIVQLTDLHNREFGEDNCELVQMVREQAPDIIVMTGDMLNADDKNTAVMTKLIESVSDIAPVYFGYGNHEVQWEKRWKRSLAPLIYQSGAIPLNTTYWDMKICGQKIRIGGYMGYYTKPHMLSTDKDRIAYEKRWADEFEDTDRLKILLNHIPTQWVDWNYYNTRKVDIIFSGHYHGGMIRIPLLERGLYAPYVGKFPKHVRGVFYGKNGLCILSAGLGTEHNVPRINNPPEITVTDILPADR